jgi:hypothetical protein
MVPDGGVLSFQLEPEIRALMEKDKDLELVAESLIQNFQEQFIQDRPLPSVKETVREICRFLLNGGLNQVLVRFCLRHLTNEKFPFPWAYFLEAIERSGAELDHEVIQYIAKGLESTRAEKEIAFLAGAFRFVDDPSGLKSQLRKSRLEDYAKLRSRLKDEALTLRSQQIFDQEKALLIKMEKMFPGDVEISNDLRNHRELRAMDVLSRRSPLGRGARTTETPSTAEAQQLTSQLRASFQESLATEPGLTFDFAVAAFMIEDYETCLELLSELDLTLEQKWFQLEVKLKCRRFLEVLSELTKIEVNESNDPETFFATAYLRAQAYWGLEQKHTAIEVLESILSVRPQYRSGATLLDIWRAL